MERLGWEPEAKHDANPNALGAKAREAAKERRPAKTKAEPTAAAATDAAPAEAAPTVAETKEALEKSDPLAPKREQLKGLIAELGLMLEDGRVTSKERAEIRVARKQMQEQLAASERESISRIEAALKQVEERETAIGPKAAKIAEFEAAVASGDHEAIAKFAGFESYDKWQEHVIALKQDPAYKRLRALEQQAAERAKADAEREERARQEAEMRQQHEERQRSTQAQIEARRVYIADLTGKMAASEDPIVKAMSDDPAFVGAVFRVQQENWDGGPTVMRPEDAINKPARGESQTLRQQLERIYKKLTPIFAGQPGAQAPKPAPTQSAAPKRSTAPSSPKPPPPSVKKMDDSEWKKQAAARLSEAAREEAIERRGRRTG
jgi:hypothetical protein